MPINSLLSLLSLLILAATIIIVLIAAACFKKSTVPFGLTLIGLIVAFGSLVLFPLRTSVTPLLTIDGNSSLYTGLILASSFVVAILSHGYLRIRQASQRKNEYYLLLLLATLGSIILVASNHFASFFLGLEILSVSLYVLISFNGIDSRSLEASAKYLVLAGSSSAFLLFGMALVYASFGTMDFSRIGEIAALHSSSQVMPLVGAAMIFVGIGFKLALAPFHMWSPDIYEGAPAPISGFVATVSKGAMVALLLRYFVSSNFHLYSGLNAILSFLAIASMFTGNLLALRQNNIKRLLAYSSIAHLGYVLVALLVVTETGASAVTFYLVAYFVTTLSAFGVISVVSGVERDADQIADYQGMFWQRPLLALIFSIAILSLAGMPLTAGFIGKFYLVSTGISGSLWSLVILLVINSAIGLYYYLRIIVMMFTSQTTPTTIKSVDIQSSYISVILLMALSCIIIFLGLYPSPLLDLITSLQMSPWLP